VSVGILKLGCIDLVSVDPGVEISSAYYCDVLPSKQLLSVMREVSGGILRLSTSLLIATHQSQIAIRHRKLIINWLKTMLRASCAGALACDTVRLLEQAMPAFIPPDLWPADSPDLNLVDYRIWSVIQQRVYQSQMHDTDRLKQRLQQVWRNVDQSIINNAIDEWCKHLRACVQANGRHFEHML